MTVEELIDELRQYEPETEVRLAQQPHWPFEYALGRVVEVKLAADRDLDALDDPDCPEEHALGSPGAHRRRSPRRVPGGS